MAVKYNKCKGASSPIYLDKPTSTCEPIPMSKVF
jgi:hypothetical protein